MENRIKILREQHGMKQRELAEELGISQNTLSTWETGRYEPDTGMLKKIASVFNVSVDYLLGGDPPWTNMRGDQLDYLGMIRLMRTIEQLTPPQFDQVIEYAKKIMLNEEATCSQPPISDADAAILRAYHAASLRDRGLIDQILQAYIEAEDTGKSVG